LRPGRRQAEQQANDHQASLIYGFHANSLPTCTRMAQ
jgi:hypothetical protein